MFDLASGEDEIGTRLMLTELRDTVKSLNNVEVNATAAIKDIFNMDNHRNYEIKNIQ